MPDITLVRDLAAFAVTFLLSGWLLGLAIFPGTVGAQLRLQLSLSLSVPATLLISVPALITHQLTLRVYLLSLTVLMLVAAGTVTMSGRAVSGIHIRIKHRSKVHINWLYLTGCVVAVALGWLTVYRPQMAILEPNGELPHGPVTWYYLWLVSETISSRGIPSTIAEWGTMRSFPVEYAASTIHAAITSVLGGGFDMTFAQRYRLVEVGLAIAAFYALWRRWLPAWWAWTGALLMLSTSYLSGKFLGSAPETFGFTLVAWSAWLFDQSLDRRSYRWGAITGFVSAIAFLAHAEVWLLTVPLWGGILLSRLLPHIVSRRSLAVKRWRLSTARRVALITRPLLLAVISVLVFATVWVGGGLVTGNLARVLDLTSRIKSSSGTTHQGQDPTWQLVAAMTDPRLLNIPPPNVFSQIIDSVWSRTIFPGLNLGDTDVRIALGVAIVLITMALRWAPRAAVRGAVTWMVFGVGVYVIVAALTGFYHTYIPQRAATRLREYDALLLVGVLSGIGWLVTATTHRVLVVLLRRYRREPKKWTPWVLALTNLAVAVVMFVKVTPLHTGTYREYNIALNPAVYDSLKWMRKHLPTGTVILAAGYTQGTIGEVGGMNGWIDGRAPYLESPAWRDGATRRLLNIRTYFLDPTANQKLLPAQVDYILAGPQPLGTAFPVNIASLIRAPNLRFIRSWGQGMHTLGLFKVIHKPHVSGSVRLNRNQ